MKRSTMVFLIVVTCGMAAQAGYDYVIESGYGLPQLNGSKTLLMTGGGGDGLMMTDHSFARIEGTSPLQEFYGGIWTLLVGGEAHLEFAGGEVHQLDLGTYGTAVLSGGRIDLLSSRQNAWKYDGDPPVLVPNPHIMIVCELDSVNYNTQTKILTGNWLDSSPFNIRLIDEAGYSPTIDNIQFIPEPATLVLMGFGAFLLHRRRA
ncbi:MAG TPA: PEP-CTERM sorting domain-containing protein [Anaerohalosphaeraceae bacterium]|jgi:hypothetical protein|nr:PEP-CTERM sorting domain-containing protein [Anaerohalosphaeraceae bacterium]HRT51875.1 PEP-CTERM sorting domain-containing protein [Anaerohalosphaeraceae bacterium]HRT87872.1 PEP-CTERM sorting domain-containing protein [Anaerohalosphaeraceae bacterium]